MFRLARLPGAVRLMFRLARLGPLGRLGYRPLVAGPLDRDLVRSWLEPGATDARIRADVRRFLRSVDPAELVAASERLDRFDGEVLVAWAPDDRFFRIADGRRLAGCFRSSRVVEIAGGRTFVSLDQPERLAGEIAEFCGVVGATSGSPPASA
jgi:pimeloyl-ACP methyl ester carboxylesterase